MAQGATSLHLLRMLRELIAAEVHDAVRRAIAQDAPVQLPCLAVSGNDGAKTVLLEVLPMHTAGSHPRCFLVLFPPVRNPFESDDLLADESTGPFDKDHSGVSTDDDLTVTKLYLRSLIEERDARNQELAQISNDLTNLLNSVNLPLSMLNNDLQIRQFTPLTQRLMNIRASDIGRPINEIRLNLDVENLEPILLDVLDSLGTRELEVQDREGHWRLLRVRPYRTADNKIEGVVLVLLDIDELRPQAKL